jgi:hypothetical protein
MRIIASAGSPNGWLEAMGYKGTLIPGIFDGEMLSGYYLGANLSFPDVKIPVDSDELFIALQIDSKNFSRGSYNAGYIGNCQDIINNSTLYDDKIVQRLFRILNSSGQLIASFGCVNGKNSISDIDAFGVHSYEVDSQKSPKASSGTQTGTGVCPIANSFGRGIFLHYKYDRTDPTKSFFRYYWGNTLLGELTGSQLTNNPDPVPAFFTVFSTRVKPGSRGLNIRSLVIADQMDFTLKVINVKPTSLNNAAQWTGSLADITEWIPSKTYLSTAVESDASFDVNMGINNTEVSAMSVNTPLGSKILSLKVFLGARYVQSGGTSTRFKIELFKSGVSYLEPVELIIPANEDNTLFLAKKVINTALSNGDKLSDIANITVKITLVG